MRGYRQVCKSLARFVTRDSARKACRTYDHVLIEQHVDPRRGPQDCAEQVVDVARASALAERRRLARDLHDSATQTLISLQLSAQAAAELWDTQPAQARAALDLVRHLAAGAAVEMRALLVDLHDAVLEQHGLVGALEVYS